ncbi:MAG TPA: hypothetical protein VGK96_01645 [Candidatus Sulfotelmatobacter sp.]
MSRLRLYRLALRLYPTAHREQFGEEMVAVFGELQAETDSRGVLAQSRFCLRETAGVVAGALREHWRVWGGEHVWLLFSSRRFTMHSEFRFPKATAVLMTIILAGVVLAIQKGEAIHASVPDTNLPVGPIHPVHSTLLPGVVIGLASFYAAGLIGWAILFALRRSGVHRLDETSAK